MATIDLNGPILATKVLCGNETIAEDVTLSLPNGALQTVDFDALGTLTVPIPRTDNLEATINTVGLDKGLFKLLGPESHQYEFRMAQNVVKRDGSQKTIGIKAFITGSSPSLLGGDTEVGSISNGSISINATRYRLVIDGEEVMLIDKLKGILKVNGKDYAEDIRRLV